MGENLPYDDLMEYVPSMNLMKVNFRYSWTPIQKHIHDIAKEKGWWDKKRSGGELIALMHSELSEALEALREGDPDSKKIEGFSQVEIELADAVIRIMDMAEAQGLDIAEAVLAKMEYNKNREYRHGDKEF